MTDDGPDGPVDVDPDRYDRLPSTDEARTVDDRPSREAVLAFFRDRYGVDPATFDGHTLWEKGAGSVWVAAGDEPSPLSVETLGLRLLRTGGHDWKPTTDGVGWLWPAVDRRVVHLDRDAARRFVRGEDQPLAWDGGRGYVVAATTVAGEPAPLGVGFHGDATLRSQVPKGRRLDLPADGS